MKKANKKLKIGVAGLWHLGCVYATGLAEMGFRVEGFDENKKVINGLNKGVMPIFEPGLEELGRKHLSKNLLFTNDFKKFIEDKDYIFVTYDLPVDKKDRVKMDPLLNFFEKIKKTKSIKCIFVVSSQVILGTCRKLTDWVIYFPENIRLGKAIDSFLQPERIILGSKSVDFMEKFCKDFSDFNCPILKMGLESAEMTKHALNSYLATCVSFSSEIGDLCEITGANMMEVVAALKSDKRVSQFAPINPGLGFAGATLGRDIQSLKKIAKDRNYSTKLLDKVYGVNQDRIPWLLKKIKNIYPKLAGKNIGVMGLTYKPGTNTLRRSMSLELIKKLSAEGGNIRAIDPVIKKEVKGFKNLTISQNFNDFFKNLDIAILMTEWPEFRDIDVKNISKLIKNRIVLDTKNFLDKEIYLEHKFKYLGTGF